MSDDLPALLLVLATENAELRQQLATAQDLLMETAIDAGQLHARIEEIQAERDAWRAEAERLAGRHTQRSGNIVRPIAEQRTVSCSAPFGRTAE